MAESKKLASICCPCFTDNFLFPVVSFLLDLEKHKPYAPDHTTTPMNTLRPYLFTSALDLKEDFYICLYLL